MTAEELQANRADQTEDTLRNKCLDDEYFASKDIDLPNVKVPLLSVANWVVTRLVLAISEFANNNRVASISTYEVMSLVT